MVRVVPSDPKWRYVAIALAAIVSLGGSILFDSTGRQRQRRLAHQEIQTLRSIFASERRYSGIGCMADTGGRIQVTGEVKMAADYNALVEAIGATNPLVQVTIHVTAPGVPVSFAPSLGPAE